MLMGRCGGWVWIGLFYIYALQDTDHEVFLGGFILFYDVVLLTFYKTRYIELGPVLLYNMIRIFFGFGITEYKRGKRI